MRQRVTRVAVTAVVLALVLLAVPLGAGLWVAFFADERGELERVALTAAVHVGPQFAAGDGVELPTASAEVTVGVYDLTGRLRDGAGPAVAEDVTRAAGGGSVAQGRAGGQLVVAVPVTEAEQVIGVVRASTPVADVRGRVFLGWLALLATALLALGAAVLLARRQARALSAPLEALSATARAVADGDLTARAAPCGIPEIAGVARSHNAMVERLARMLRHEREFSANASHQLRTPLAGLQLALETALDGPPAGHLPALREALEQSRHLQGTIDGVLSLAAPTDRPPALVSLRSPAEIVEGAAGRRHAAFARDGRRLGYRIDPEARALRIPAQPAGQILDIVLDNAHRHGAGSTEVHVREIGGAIALDITDEGALAIDPALLFERGSSGGQGHGIGLSLARDMAEAAGGRLSLTRTAPVTFTLLLPGPTDGDLD